MHALAPEGPGAACVQLLTVLSTALLVGWATRKFLPAAAKPVYLIDTYTYKPPDRCGCCFAAHACVGLRCLNEHWDPAEPIHMLLSCGEADIIFDHDMHTQLYLLGGGRQREGVQARKHLLHIQGV